MAPTAVVTAKMPPSELAETSLQRTGSYGRDQRASRRARRRVQRAEPDKDAITRPPGQSYRSPRTGALQFVGPVSSDVAGENLGVVGTDREETSATVSLALPETETVSVRHSGIVTDQQHHANSGEELAQKQVEFEEHGGPSAQITRKPHGGCHQGLVLIDGFHTEAAETYGTRTSPPAQHRPHRREKSTYQQGTYHQGLDISLREAEILRNLERHMASELAERASQGVYEADLRFSGGGYREQLESSVTRPVDVVSQRVKSKSRYSYQMGLNLVESSQSDAE